MRRWPLLGEIFEDKTGRNRSDLVIQMHSMLPRGRALCRRRGQRLIRALRAAWLDPVEALRWSRAASALRFVAEPRFVSEPCFVS